MLLLRGACHSFWVTRYFPILNVLTADKNCSLRYGNGNSRRSGNNLNGGSSFRCFGICRWGKLEGAALFYNGKPRCHGDGVPVYGIGNNRCCFGRGFIGGKKD